MTNHVIHVATANSHYRRAARLAFQGCEAKCFLNTGMNEKIGRTIKPGELAGIGAVANPRNVVSSQLQFTNLRSVGPVADHEQMKFTRPASLQILESAKQSRCVLLFRQPAYVKKQGLT